MKESSVSNVGFLIAYVLPGFTALWGCSYFSEPIRGWLAATPANAPTVGGFLYVTLGSVAAGMTVSTIRWLTIDRLHHATGIPQPDFDFSRFPEFVAAYDRLTEIHYAYYKFHANMFVALAFLYIAHRISASASIASLSWLDAGFLLLETILLLGSRDTLSKYYARTSQFLRADRNQHAACAC